MEKKLSIIVPIYNAEAYLKHCLESLIDPEVELVLVNDGSIDDSANIISEFQQETNQDIIVIHQKNKGVSEARNRGLQKCTGDWIFFVDSDDYLTENAIPIIKSYLNQDSELIIFPFQRTSFQTKIVAKKGSDYTIEATKLVELALLGENREQEFSNYDFRSSCGKLINRKLLQYLKFDSNIYIGEDFLVMLKIYSKISTVTLVNTQLYCYYDNQNSVVNSFHKNYQNNIDIVYHNINRIIRNCSNYDSETIELAFSFYKINDFLLLLKYDYFNQNNHISWNERKNLLNKAKDKYRFKEIYFKLKESGNIKKISYQKRILYFILYIRLYFLAYWIFKLKYRR